MKKPHKSYSPLLRIVFSTILLTFLFISYLSAQIGLNDAHIEGKPYPLKKGQAPIILLDTSDITYNSWKQLRNFGAEPKREPGIINVQQYEMQHFFMGIPTFFHLPVALSPADLKASQVDVVILGAHTDMSGGFRGAAYGPNAIRNSEVYGGWGVIESPNMHVLVDPFKTLVCADFGDAPIDIMSTERSVHAIRDFVRSAVEVELDNGEHVIPFIVGGDHSLMYPDVAALVDVYGVGNVGVIHFDCHYDAGKYGYGHLVNHGMPVYRLIDEGLVPGKNFIQVGLRGYYPDEKTFDWMRENEFRYHTMAEVERRGWAPVVEDAIKEATDGPEYLFISFDVDVIDPAFMAGTGTPEPGGLTTREANMIVRRLCAETNVVGFELVELNPLVDPSYVSTLNANRVLREALTGIAMRKLGLTEKHWLHPKTVDDGR